jgi:hypothetical protein
MHRGRALRPQKGASTESVTPLSIIQINAILFEIQIQMQTNQLMTLVKKTFPGHHRLSIRKGCLRPRTSPHHRNIHTTLLRRLNGAAAT